MSERKISKSGNSGSSGRSSSDISIVRSKRKCKWRIGKGGRTIGRRDWTAIITTVQYSDGKQTDTPTNGEPNRYTHAHTHIDTLTDQQSEVQTDRWSWIDRYG